MIVFHVWWCRAVNSDFDWRFSVSAQKIPFLSIPWALGIPGRNHCLHCPSAQMGFTAELDVLPCFTLTGKAPREWSQRGEVVVLYWNSDLMESVKWIYACMLVFILSDLIRSSVLRVKLALAKQCSWSFLKLSEVDSCISANSCSQFLFSWYFSAMQFLFIPKLRLKSVKWEGELLAQSCSLRCRKFDFVANSPGSPKPHE